MPINSVNTNQSALIALQSLNATNKSLAAVQKQISTGYRVADAVDDGAAYAIAQGIRSTVGALTSANQQLGSTQGLLSTTMSGLTNINTTMASMRDILVKLSDNSVTGADRSNYAAKFTSQLANVKTFIQDSNYNGKSLIGDLAGGSGSFARVVVARNDTGSSYGLATFSGSALSSALNFKVSSTTYAATLDGTSGTTAASAAFLGSASTLAGYKLAAANLPLTSTAYAASLDVGQANTALSVAFLGSAGTLAGYKIGEANAGLEHISAAAVKALISATGAFVTQLNSVSSALNTVGSETNYVNNQVSYNSDKIDALNTGLGSLVDADLAKESAQLQSLQIRQQLGTQSLSIANQAPAALLSLFK
jgi:flagellin